MKYCLFLFDQLSIFFCTMSKEQSHIMKLTWVLLLVGLRTGYPASALRVNLVTATKYENVCCGVHIITRHPTFPRGGRIKSLSNQLSACVVNFKTTRFRVHAEIRNNRMSWSFINKKKIEMKIKSWSPEKEQTWDSIMKKNENNHEKIVVISMFLSPSTQAECLRI